MNRIFIFLIIVALVLGIVFIDANPDSKVLGSDINKLENYIIIKEPLQITEPNSNTSRVYYSYSFKNKNTNIELSYDNMSSLNEAYLFEQIEIIDSFLTSTNNLGEYLVIDINEDIIELESILTKEIIKIHK